MLTITHNNKHIKINLKRFIASMLTIIFVISCFNFAVDFLRYPEKYKTIQKYHLLNDINSGNAEAIKYYNNNYLSKGVYLYGEEAKSDFLNLATVTTFEATSDGVMLITEDGSGYYIEK